jgi:hypothetical protein
MRKKKNAIRMNKLSLLLSNHTVLADKAAPHQHVLGDGARDVEHVALVEPNECWSFVAVGGGGGGGGEVEVEVEVVLVVEGQQRSEMITRPHCRGVTIDNFSI